MITTKPIDIEDAHADILQNAFKKHLSNGVHVYAFGSRANWCAKRASDLDLAIDANDALKRNIGNLEEELSLSDLPYKVDIVNLNSISDSFRKAIMPDLVPILWDWKETTLSELCYRIGDGLHGTPKYTIDTQYYFINGNNLKKGQVVITKNTKKIDYKEFQKYKKDLGLNTILLSINGTIGNLAKYNNELCVLSKSIAYLNIRDDIIKNFIYYLMLDSKFQKNISHNANGSTIKNVSLAQLKNYSILLPPLLEQKAIASVLSSIDDKIDLLHRQNNTLESIAETIFRQWFIEEADDSWEKGKLGDFIIPRKGKNITKSQAIDGEYPVIAGGLSHSCYHNQCNTDAPVITISASGANAGFVNLHYNPIWSSDSSFIDSKTTNYIYFFYMFLKYYQEGIYDKQEGTAQSHIYPSHLIDLDVLKYPLNLIKNYEFNITPLFSKIKHNQKQIKTLECLRDMLLPKLISGDIRVEYEEVL